jgi:hypothetical protein
MSCDNHVRHECRYCYEIVEQCGCHNAQPKIVTRDKTCGSCRAQSAAEDPSQPAYRTARTQEERAPRPQLLPRESEHMGAGSCDQCPPGYYGVFHHGVFHHVSCPRFAPMSASSRWMEPKVLTDAELESLEYHGCSSGTSTPPMIRDAIVKAARELRGRRAARLTVEEQEALRELTSYTSADLPRSAGVAYSAIARIARILATYEGDGAPKRSTEPR